MKRKKDNVVYFKSSFREEFIKSKACKYGMPVELVDALVLNQELHGFDVLSKSGRTYMEDCISINAIRYHL